MSTATVWQSDRLAVASAVAGAGGVGAMVYVLDESTVSAATAAAGFLVLKLLGMAAERVVGDYAEHVLLGVLALVVTGYLAVAAGAVWVVAVGAAIGGWFLLDGVQHLRYGVGRDEVGLPYRHEGRVRTGFPKALLARLVEPVGLSVRARRGHLGGEHGRGEDGSGDDTRD